VTSHPRPDGDRPESGKEVFALVIELSLTDGDPVSGTIGVIGGSLPVPFDGWIDLMSAINSLRANAHKTA
jgi:hypothetical protein